jgi:type III pantothenate kinase
MTPDVVVDIGNSRIKWGRCYPDGIPGLVSLAPDSPHNWNLQATAWNLTSPVAWAVAGVHPARVEQFTKWATSRGDRVRVIEHAHVPLAIDVDEPDKVGIDRLLGGLAAKRRVQPGSPALVIGVGSAMTIDFLDERGIFRGGAILPGPWMMARALHEFTAKLPLVEPRVLEPEQSFGRNTREAIEVGIQAAIYGAADVVIWNVSRTVTQKLSVFVTGGGMSFVRGIAFVADLEDVEYSPTLTLEGIRLAAEGLP